MDEVPIFVNLAGTSIIESTKQDATSALYDIISGVQLEGERYVAIEGAQVYCYGVYFKALDVTALYVQTDVDIKNAYSPVVMRVARWQYGPSLMPYGLVNTNEVLQHAFWITSKSRRMKPSLASVRFIANVFSGVIDLPVLKVSASHLRHITVKELAAIDFQTIISKAGFMFNVIKDLYQKGDMHEAFFVGLILWACTMPDTIYKWISSSSVWMWTFNGIDDFVKIIKEKLTLRMKALQNLVPIDLTPMFEMEVLVNRGVGEVDWEKEKRHRVQPNVANFERDEIMKEAIVLFKRAVATGQKPKRLKWEKFWRERWQWAPTGAFHSQYEEDQKFRSKDRLSRNKLDAVTRMPKVSLQHFTGRPPQIRAWSSIKYEWMKMRAIYGVDMTNFIITGFAMGDCERVLSKLFPIGESATDENVRRTVREVLRNGQPFCFDYEDFNSQHSNSSMQAVLDAYLLVFRDHLSEEQVEAMSWSVNSLNDVKIKQPNGEWYEARGTLLSGWRLTTFVNTVLNYVYIKIMQSKVAVTTHNGDDVLAAVSSFAQIQDLERKAIARNVRFQGQKCFLGGVAEFLRIDHNNNQSGQYLCRAISTYVHGPTESTLPNNVLEIYRSFYERKKEIVERGGEECVLNKVHDKATKFISKKWKVDDGLYNNFIKTNILYGGVSESIDDDAFEWDIRLVKVRSNDKRANMQQIQVADYPGAYDYALAVSNNLFGGSFFNKILHAVLSSLELNQSNVRFRVDINRRTPEPIDKLNSIQRGTFKSVTSKTKLMLARASGIPAISMYDEVYKIRELLASEKDIDKALAIYT